MDDYSTPISELNDMPSINYESKNNMKQKAEKLNDQLVNLYAHEIDRLNVMLTDENKKPAEQSFNLQVTPKERNEYITIFFLLVILFSSTFSDLVKQKAPGLNDTLTFLLKIVLTLAVFHFSRKYFL